ncbi:nitroreductase family protein [Desulfopila sp. IMCC35006]|uniref:nitroreductase family protein n=1 Tax=Desulfopila sp. IMCC35006 TaxID=2569542 RepID=UPI0010AD3E3A|nr:nitroreductase family protein [Desulfopila sp. IMCC35006]TKB27027.1 nitroreductase family protein [Desulfopila sp. IMCC35006]
MQEIIVRTRTFRRFVQKEPLSTATLHELIDLARLGGSARNGQPWQYMVVNDAELCARIFPYLGWAGYLPDWHGPVEGERPSAYVLCLLNKNRLKGPESEAQFDLGIATQNLLLGAMEKKIGGCRIGAFNPKLATLFRLADNLRLSLVIALGKPIETVIIEQCRDEDDVRYWRDEHGVHHVPKRSLESCLVEVELFDDGVTKRKSL